MCAPPPEQNLADTARAGMSRLRGPRWTASPVSARPEWRRLPAVRPKRELWLWLWLGGLALTLVPLLAAIAITYFSKDTNYSLFSNFWMPAAGLALVAAFVCFLGAISGWPFPPRAQPGFPDIKVDIFGAGTMETEHESGTGLIAPAHLRSFDVRFASAEAERRVSLSALLYLKLVPGSWGRAGEAVCPPPRWALPPTLSGAAIGMPMTLPAGDEISGHLIFEVPAYYLDKLVIPAQGRLELRDDVSGRRMTIPAELGSYSRSQMVPSSGGAATLGPEFGERVITPGETGS